jgi:hypothetical protein
MRWSHSFLAAWLLSSIAGIAALPEPPPMPKRTIAPSTNEFRGAQIVLTDRGTNFTLFLPQGWTNAVSSNTVLFAHFHTIAWFAIQEHVRREAREPLIVFALGEGSSTYRTPFTDTNRFVRMIALVESELKKRGAAANTRVAHIDVSSFSAGYGAVRELVQQPPSFQIIRRIILLDSMYASLEPEEAGATNRRPLAAQIDVWVPFARAAVRGGKTFVLTHSQVPTLSHASSFECAAALATKAGVEFKTVATNSLPATRDPDFPLLRRADAGKFHIWSYGGKDAQAHLTHIRHMADVWHALNEATSDR